MQYDQTHSEGQSHGREILCDVTFGDGSIIDAADMALAIKIADELTYDLNWQAGDVVLIDNFTVMHGRRPYEGKRRVLASLIK